MTSIITFIDLFCGIGGIRIAFEKSGCKCIFSCESEQNCVKTYQANFNETPVGDIRNLKSSQIPDSNILCAGFPCQPFSIAGLPGRAFFGKEHAFNDENQGLLFFELLRILKEKQPQAFFFENVPNLKTCEKGAVFQTIKSSIKNLGYSFYHRIIDAGYITSQHRERLYMVGFKDKNTYFEYPSIPKIYPNLKDILQKDGMDEYTLTDHQYNYIKAHHKKHYARGNGFGYSLINENKQSPTITSHYHKGGYEILIPQDGKNPRTLSPKECATLQGFPDTFKFVGAESRMYKQIGNSVSIPIVELIAKQIVKSLNNPIRKTKVYDSYEV